MATICILLKTKSIYCHDAGKTNDIVMNPEATRSGSGQAILLNSRTQTIQRSLLRMQRYLPEDEEQLINGETGRFLFFGNKLDSKSYNLLDDEVIWIGGIKILPIPVPGHTPGSTCYVVGDKYLFTGDALSLHASGIDLFPKFINKNTRRAKKSMSKITDLNDVQYIFTGHYGYTDDYRSAVSQWKELND
jgi:glyoxylase-like metal-dependent hydrolase (beta-lactamase superfamily II)